MWKEAICTKFCSQVVKFGKYRMNLNEICVKLSNKLKHNGQSQAKDGQKVS